MEFYHDYYMANRNYLLSFTLYVPLKGGGVLIGGLW